MRLYLTRFNAAVLESQDIRLAVKVDIFTYNLKCGPLFVSMIKRPTQSWEELLLRTDKFINLEDFVLEKHLENTLLKEASKAKNRGRKEKAENSGPKKKGTREI